MPPKKNTNTGWHHSEETKKKIGEKSKGRIPSEETRKKISEAGKGRVASEETLIKARMRAPPSEETRRKISLAGMGRPSPRKGTHLSPEHKKRISESHMGEKHWMHGKHLSDEHKAKTSNALKGRIFSEDTKTKISEAKCLHQNDIWYGGVKNDRTAGIYCKLWKEVNPRVHAYFDYKCVICGKKEDAVSHIGHHVFYNKLACCEYNEDGMYYTNLNARNHIQKDYCIGENPNYFVILCKSCHAKTNGNYDNRKKWADYFKNFIDVEHGGICYLPKEE